MMPCQRFQPVQGPCVPPPPKKVHGSMGDPQPVVWGGNQAGLMENSHWFAQPRFQGKNVVQTIHVAPPQELGVSCWQDNVSKDRVLGGWWDVREVAEEREKELLEM